MATYEVWLDGRLEHGKGPRYATLKAAIAAGEAEVGRGEGVAVATAYGVWEFDDEGWLNGPVATGPRNAADVAAALADDHAAP